MAVTGKDAGGAPLPGIVRLENSAVGPSGIARTASPNGDAIDQGPDRRKPGRGEDEARPCGLELHCHDHRIGDALCGGGSRAEAMRFARGFRLLAILLDHLIEHYPCRQASGIYGDTVPFVIETNRAGTLLATLGRALVNATQRQMRHAPMRLAFEPIDSS